MEGSFDIVSNPKKDRSLSRFIKLKKKDEVNQFHNQILEEIRNVCLEMEVVGSRFEIESDNDLIDACIYELEALRARYRYLLRIAKQEGITSQNTAV